MSSVAAESLEREFKFGAGMEQELPDLRPVVGRALRQPRQRLHTRYFDTPDGRLWEHFLTLRHRATDAGDGGLWTLKLPKTDSGAARTRVELSWSGHHAAIPAEACRILRGLVRREPMRQVVELATERQRLLLQDPDDQVLAELDDDVVKVIGGPRDGLRFRQIELELREGGESFAKPVRATLKAAGLRVESVQKLAKALGQPPGGMPTPVLDHSSSVDQLLRSSLRHGYERLVEHDWRIRAKPDHPRVHAIHQARVASRRLRSDLKAFGNVLDPVWLRHVRTDLKWVGTALGDVRDADVLRSHLDGLPAELGQLLDNQRSAAIHRLSTVLTSDRYVDLLDRLHAASELLPLGSGRSTERAHDPAKAVVPALVGAQLRALRKQARRAKAQPSPKQLHQTRIRAKRLRYASEAVAPIIGKPARTLAAAAEGVQGNLGEHHDAVEAQAWLRRQARTSRPPSVGHLSTDASFDAGFIAATQRARQEAYEDKWRRSWKRVEAAMRHWPSLHQEEAPPREPRARPLKKNSTRPGGRAR